MGKWGALRLELAVYLRDHVLPKLNIRWAIENGTLLAAYRNGKFIPHDDDFDICLFFDDYRPEALKEVCKKIKELLPPKYDCRVLFMPDAYADKIEVFQPSCGIYTLAGP